MKKIFGLLIVLCLSVNIYAQNIVGAWENFSISESGEKHKSVKIFTDHYQVLTTYNATTGAFIYSKGGLWTLEKDTITEIIEFDTKNSNLVGTEISYKINITDNAIKIIDKNIKINKIDDGTPGELQGAWLMSGRIKDGKTQSRDIDTPRKTMKILSGTRFQWIAYNTETKQFMGTGGGTYTTLNGEYTENIEFFSKDDSKTGRSLNFNYEFIDGNWHHTGYSSKGDPIHEIWSITK
ncbi:membrane or secreted protein [Winogradskyella wichelsiae]|uniref:membrane or secreted protein n=1 Tax=Winogradskyella wichelsiae TaxID=2697007 RepID=UPI0015CD2658|nr:membrane or secreted protein [Winogradskyella wichelsiae]